ncbi:DMT family transporter [Sedimentibacter sp. zth1]|uniref:DMT family transporter n=1 Tax=Sedimentibacter sp. zth1 TaxID=2816908 RepID=UPI001A93450D|nr:DMT family transporter [Sedimentibacter sp. zth1]QSX05787.1 DMT family transporter [Sedimentibacter sp. zth1]
MNKKKSISTIMLVLTAIIWGSSFVAQSKGMDYIGPFTFNAVRNIIGGLVLIPFIYFFEKIYMNKVDKENEELKSNKKLIIGGVFCGLALFLGSTFQQFGIMCTTAGKSGFITALYIVIVPILGIFIKKKIPFKVFISVVIAMCGFYLLCINEGFSINKGDLLTLVCAVFFSVHILVIDYFSPQVDGVKLSCIQFFVCGIISLICMFIFENPTISNILSAWLPILYAGVLSCGVAYTMQIIAQKNTEPVIASLILSLESVFAVIAGWIFLHQSLSPKEMCGCILVFIAIIITQIPERKKIIKNI